jgi:hypothetical protein
MAVQYPNSSDPENRLLAKLLQNGVGPNYYVSGDSTWTILRKLLANQATGIVGSSTDVERNLIAKLLRNNAQAEGGGGGGGGVTPPTPYRYYRFTITTNSPSGYVEIGRLLLLDPDGVNIYATMTADNLPAPQVASSNQAAFGTFAFNAFDLNPGTRWHTDTPSNGDWVQIDLGVVPTNGVAAVAISVRNSTTRFPPTFTIHGSLTGAFGGEEVLLYTSPTLNASSWLADNQIRVFVIDPLFDYTNVVS